MNFTCYVSCYRFFVIFLLDATEDEMRRIIPRFKNFDLENICTPINVVNLEDLLKKTGYNKEETDFLIHGFSQGFTLGYRGPCNQRDLSKNIPFSPGVGDKFDMWEKIMKEVSTGRYAGPWKFEDLPYNEFVQLPIGLVPKAGGQTRLMFHLSYKFQNGNESINYWTPEELCSVKYRDIDHAIRNCLALIKELENKSFVCQCLFFGKSDLKNAFHVAPLSRRYWKFLMLKVQDPETGVEVYFVDKCMPFGASISCSHFPMQ